MELAGRVALVTGAARGIGQAIALELAAAGAAVAVLDAHLDRFEGESYYRLRSRTSGEDESVSTLEQLRQRGASAVAVEADVADAGAVAGAVQRVADELGGVDVLVSNAGITTNFVSLAATKPTDWDREISVNLSGAFHCMRAVAPAMAERGWGRIVVISSVAAHTPGLHPAYAASKSGLHGLTRAVAKEYAATGVTANAVLPGLTATAMVRAVGPEEVLATGIPAQRLGTPEEVAAAVRFLASPAASYVTGIELSCDGGMVLGPPLG